MIFIIFLITTVQTKTYTLESGNATLKSPIIGTGESTSIVRFQTATFRKPPQVALAIAAIEMANQLSFDYQVYPIKLNELGLIIQNLLIFLGFDIIIQGTNIDNLIVNWIAFDDTYAKAFQLKINVTQNQVYQKVFYFDEVNFSLCSTCNPSATVFLNGIYFSLGRIQKFYLSVVRVTNKSIEIKLENLQLSSQIIFVMMSVIIANPEIALLMNENVLGQPDIQIALNHPISFQNLHKQSCLVGFTGYQFDLQTKLSNQLDLLTIEQKSQEILTGKLLSSDAINFKIAIALFRTACVIECLTCKKNVNNICESCTSSRQLNLTTQICECQRGYFELFPVFEECGACNKTCLTCSINENNCTSCDKSKFRDFDSTGSKCICFDGYFQNFSDTKDISCKSCHHTCKTCKNDPILCESCRDSDFREYIPNEKRCDCKTNFYEILESSIYQCKKCVPICQTCFITDKNCTSCFNNHFRQLVRLDLFTSSCLCQDGYFENSTNAVCQKCKSYCKTCNISADHCLSCSEEKNLIYDPIFYKCICYDDGYNYETVPYCQIDENIEQAQLRLMKSNQKSMVTNIQTFTQDLYNYDSGEGYFLFIMRRTTAFQLIGTYDQSIAHFHFLNITYPLNVFECERMLSLFIFDYIENYTNTTLQTYLLFAQNVTDEVYKSNQIYNFFNVGVTSLFLVTSIDIVIASIIYLLLSAAFQFIRTKYFIPEQEMTEVIQVYKISDDVDIQNRQWVKWQAEDHIREQFWMQYTLDFCYLWLLEGRMVVFLNSLLLQLANPTFNTNLQRLSFYFGLQTLTILVLFFSYKFFRLRQIILKRNLVVNMQEQKLLERLDRSLRAQYQRLVSGLSLDGQFSYLFHYFGLLKKLLFAIICVINMKGVIQLWLLLTISVIFFIVKIIIRPYLALIRNVMVILCDGLFIICISLKLNDYYNYEKVSTSDFKGTRNTQIENFLNQGDITIGFEITFIIISFLLQLFIMTSYIQQFCKCKNKPAQQQNLLPRRELNIEVFSKNDFQRILLELNDLEQVKVLSNMSKIFRQGSVILEEFLEFEFAFNKYFLIQLKNVNLKQDMIIYSVDRHIKNSGLTIKLGELNDVELPVQLKPFQSISFSQNIVVEKLELSQSLILTISYQRVISNLKEQNLIILQATLCAGIQNLVRNVDMNEYEARMTYQERYQHLVRQSQSSFSSKQECKLYWILVKQFIGYVIETGEINDEMLPLSDEKKSELSARQTLIAKFLLPEIDSKENMQNNLEIYLIVERQQWQSIIIELWHRRFGQFATYDTSQLYYSIMKDFHDSVINFYTK